MIRQLDALAPAQLARYGSSGQRQERHRARRCLRLGRGQWSMARSMAAAVQDALADEVLHCRVRAPQLCLDAVEHDLLALVSDRWHPVGKGVEDVVLAAGVPLGGDPQHVERRVDSSRVQERQSTREVGSASAGVSVTL